MKSIKLLAATAAMAVSGAAIAGPSYTYVDLGYVVGVSAGDDSETEGWALRGSFGFADIFHVGAEYADGDVAGGKSDGGADVSLYDIYFGFNPALTENTDLIVRIGYAEGEGELAGDSAKLESSEIYFEAGPRGMIGDKFEWSLLAQLGYGELDTKTGSDPKQDYTNVGATVGGAYYFTPMMSVGLDLGLTGQGFAAGTSAQEGVADLYFRLSF